MKKYELNLSEFKIEVPVRKPTEKEPHAMGTEERVYPLCENLSAWLRAPGVFKTGEEIAEAVILGKSLLNAENDSIILDEREVKILKDGINRHISISAEGKPGIIPLGGPLHEEAICRIFGMKEVK